MGGQRSHLNEVWHNIRKRVAGKHVDGCGNPRWLGLSIGFLDYIDFKEWALANGYKPGLSPDRIRSDEGYVPGNIQWITKAENDAKARNSHKPMCKCFWCRGRRLSAQADAKNAA